MTGEVASAREEAAEVMTASNSHAVSNAGKVGNELSRFHCVY